MENFSQKITTLEEMAQHADYSLIETLTPDPQATHEGEDHNPRQVFSGHYVPVKPSPIPHPKYVIHSKTLFDELGLDDTLATSNPFIKMFSGDTSELPEPMRRVGWATGYALSIYGREYYNQCPFGTGNGYGDGRAISIFEGVLNGKRWEMQLKGAGRTPYARGGDGRAVLRSSIREFLAQEHMHALGIPTTRSLSLYTSMTERVKRPWFREDSRSFDPDVMIDEPTAIATRVAPSFLRVGQLELFGRRARKREHPQALEELAQIVLHAIKREYADEVDSSLPFSEQILRFATAFRERLTALVANWIRVGYTQGNFNSDNCAIGGFTLDFGPFGFIEMFAPDYQPWTGGGEHFAFLNQPNAAERNFASFCNSLKPLLESEPAALSRLEAIESDFAITMQRKMIDMWSAKLGWNRLNVPLFNELMKLMIETEVDYTILFREISWIPDEVTPLMRSFYRDEIDEDLMKRWEEWHQKWRDSLEIATPKAKEELSQKLKSINPKYILREWMLVPAYKNAQSGDYTLLYELEEVISDPYAEQSREIEEKYYRKKPSELFDIAGISYVSCSS